MRRHARALAAAFANVSGLAMAWTASLAAVQDHSAMTMPMPPEKPADSAHAAHRHDATKPSNPAPARTPQPASPSPAMPADMPGMAMTPAPDAAVTPVPPLTDADRAAAFPMLMTQHEHDDAIHHAVFVDRLEGGGAAVAWEARGWIGTDLDRLWLRSEGERRHGVTDADVEVLYGRAIAPWWDLLAGVRHDTGKGGARDFAALGVTGTAPQKIEIEATAYAGNGQTSLRLEVQRDVLLTQRLVVQPRVELDAFGRDEPRDAIGAGLSTVEAGIRLRYEFTRRFAPYVGLVRERAFGHTADLRHADGEHADATRVVAGFHFGF